MDKKLESKIRNAVKVAFSPSTATRVICNIDDGVLVSANKERMFQVLYKATKKTPNDFIDYKGES